MAKQIPFEIITHKQRVLSLFKRAMRNIENWNGMGRIELRYEQVVLRDRFDQNKNVIDERQAKHLVREGEKELLSMKHWQPRKFAKSVGGTAYGRNPHHPDWLLDDWHPLEKAQYPEYFARRELRKKEYVKLWEEEYGSLDKPEIEDK